jgi:hypothetical protein
MEKALGLRRIGVSLESSGSRVLLFPRPRYHDGRYLKTAIAT